MKMVISAMLVLLTICAHGQKEFLIEGAFNGHQEGKKVILSYYDQYSNRIADSTYVHHNKFAFKGKIQAAVKARLRMQDSSDLIGPWTTEELINADFQEFFLEDTTITVNGDNIKEATITGGPVEKDFNVLQNQVKPIDAARKPYTLKVLTYMRDGDSVKVKELISKIRGYNEKIAKVRNAFMEGHPDSYVTLDIIRESATAELDPDGFKSSFSRLSDRLRNSDMGKAMWARYLAIKSTSVGQKAPDFVQEDVQGQPFELKSARGKYVLLDFWASWCGPCRMENPNLIKAYNKYKEKGFDIISVSLDTNKDAWLKAIKKDGLPWISHISDLQGSENEVAVKYGVRGIPENFLIDPNGVIIAKGLRGEALGNKLAEIFK